MWTHGSSCLAWCEVGGQLSAVEYSSIEPAELSQWICHDDSTVNIVLDSIIISIIIIIIIAPRRITLLPELGRLRPSVLKTSPPAIL